MSGILGQLLLGWLLADLLTGIFHWWEDRAASESMPIIGRWLVAPNRLHHRDPMAFTRGTIWDRSLATFIAAGAIGLLWWLLLGPSIIMAATVAGGAASTEIHFWTHQAQGRPAIVRLLQEIGIIQSPAQHAQHHRPPSDRRYCIVTDWLNPVLDTLRLWDRLEAALARLGLEPNRGTR